MAKIVPLAIGFGIPLRELDNMTPAEIMESIDAISKQKWSDLRVIDTIVAGAKALYAAAHGVDEDLAEFRTYRPPKEEEDMTPKEWEQHLKLIAMAWKPEDA
jgi:hypothetical protein